MEVDSGQADIIGDTFDNTLTAYAFQSRYPSKIRFQYNTVAATVTVAGTPQPTRAQMDVRYNNLLGQVQPAPVPSQDLTDYSLNWWGRDLNTEALPACFDTRTTTNPPYSYDSTTGCPAYSVHPSGYFTKVLPALSAPVSAAIPAAVAQSSAPRYGPVDTVSGELTYQAADVTMQDAGKQVTAERTYRSDGVGPEADLGPGWSSSFSEALSAVNGVATMALADGRTVAFGTDPAAGYVAAPGVSAAYSTGTGGSQITTPDQDTYQFDPNGVLTGMLLGDPGHQVSIDRTGDGQLSKVTGISGRYLSYARGSGHLTSVSDSTGRSVSFGYTADGDLSSATGVDGKTETYGYDTSGRLTSVTTPLGRTKLAAGYTADGKVAWVDQQGTGRATFSYDTAELGFPSYRGHIANEEVGDGRGTTEVR